MAGKDEEGASKKTEDGKAEAKAAEGKGSNESKSSPASAEASGGGLKAERLPASGSGASGASHAHGASGNGTNGNGNGNGHGRNGARDAKDAIALLTADHRQVEQLFTRFERAGQRNEKARIAREICNALIVHTLIEEEILYPACEGHIDDRLLEQAQVEHDGTKLLIVDLMQGDPDDRYYDAKLAVLAEQVRHHLREEEKPKKGIFARMLAAGIDTHDLGQEIEQRKAELMRLAEAERLPKPITHSIRSGGLGPSRIRSMMEDEDMAQYYQQDHGGGRSSGRGGGRGGMGMNMGNERPRDEYGRFMSDDEDGDRGGRGGGGRGRYADDDYGRGGGGRGRYAEEYSDYRDRGSSGRSGGRYADDDDGRGHGRGGWFGDSAGHSRASRMGWERSDHEGSGWYGDPEGHSEASRRGWERSDHEGSGWYGDPEGHSEAARRGWEHRDDRGGRGGGRSMMGGGGGGRSRYADDDYGRGGGGRGGGGRSGRGGWFGDSEGHSEAARRGWDDRR